MTVIPDDEHKDPRFGLAPPSELQLYHLQPKQLLGLNDVFRHYSYDAIIRLNEENSNEKRM